MDGSILIRMANDIARNLPAQGQMQAVGAMVQHIHDFWDPRLKTAILSGDCRLLLPIAAQAVERLRADVTHRG